MLRKINLGKIEELNKTTTTRIDINDIETIFIPKRGRKMTILENVITWDTETCVNKDKDYGCIIAWTMCIDGTIILGRTVYELISVFKKIDEIIKNKGFKMGRCKQSYPRVRMYAHNLGYDYYFTKPFIGNDNIGEMLGDNLNPIRVDVFDCIRFQCSLKLFDRKLEKVCKDYKCTYQKTEDWDYKKIRTTKTPLTKLEIAYASIDVYGLYEALLKKSEQYGTIANVPDTKTGEVRYSLKNTFGKEPAIYTDEEIELFKENKKNNVIIYTKEPTNRPKPSKLKPYYFYNNKRYFYNNKNGWRVETAWEHDSKINRYHKYEIEETGYKNFYQELKNVFAGGYTHANRIYLGCLLWNLISYDLTSAYPAMCLSKKFVSDWHNFSKYALERRINNKGYIESSNRYLFECTFYNIESLQGFSLFSSSKALKVSADGSKTYNTSGLVLDNGRVLKAKEITLTLYSDEYNRYVDFYKWDKVEFNNVYAGTPEWLPQTIMRTTSYYYTKKCQIKSIMKKVDKVTEAERYNELEFEYNFAKQQLNSIYGCMATDYSKYIEAGEEEYAWYKEYEAEENRINGTNDNLTYEEFVDKMTEKFAREEREQLTPMNFSYGSQITMMVRCTIFDAIKNINYKSAVYSDTDSIKILLTDENKDIILKGFEKTNAKIVEEVKICAKENNIDMTQWCGVDEIGDPSKIQYIGVFDIDERYKCFKTLGAKRYAYITEKEYNKYEQGDEEYIVEYKDNNVGPIIHTTVAGISKGALSNFLRLKNTSYIGALRLFNNNLTVPVEYAKKKTHKYIERPISTNEDGDTYSNYILIEPTTFQLTLSDDVYRMVKLHIGDKPLRPDSLVDGSTTDGFEDIE